MFLLLFLLSYTLIGLAIVKKTEYNRIKHTGT